jgi:hypothetical protein
MRLLLSIAISFLAAGSVHAQPKRRPGPPPPNALMIERLNRMTPEEREQALKRLPPERRERVERRLENFNALPPNVKERLREQYLEFQKLPPERQNAIRRSFRRLNELDDDRKPVVRREVIRLRRLTPEERTSAMDSEQFRSRFNESERQLLFDLASSMPSNDAR